MNAPSNIEQLKLYNSGSEYIQRLKEWIERVISESN